MKKTLKTLSMTFIFLTVLLCSSQSKAFDVDEFYLDNGMQVIVIYNHKAPIIQHMVWYKFGSVDEARGYGGNAHFLEHLMFRGTTNIPDGEFNRLIENNGGQSNAFTSFDYTAYHQFLDVSKLELAMFLEADRMTNLDINNAILKKEREVVYQERQQVVENNPFGEFSEKFRAKLWGIDHGYAYPIIGSNEEIKKFNQKDVRHFYESFYAPNNAILVLSGDIDYYTAKELAEKYYGHIAPRDLPCQSMDAGYLEKSTVFEMVSDKISAPRWVKTIIGPEYHEIRVSEYNPADRPLLYSLIILSRYLGEGETSKLYKDLVKNQKLLLAISTSYNPFARSNSTFNISAVPMSSVEVGDLDSIIDEAIRNAVDEMTPEDVEAAKEKILAELVYLEDNPTDAAYMFGAMAAVGVPVDETLNYANTISHMTFEQVKNAAYEIFEKSNSVVGILKPTSKNSEEAGNE